MREALKVMPYSPEYHDNLGVSDCFLNNYEGARVEFDQAHRLAPDQADYLVNLATVYQWEKKTAQALSLYKKGILRKSEQSGQPYRLNPATQIGGKRPPKSDESGHIWRFVC